MTALRSDREQPSWMKLFPDRFGDYFEIFSFLMHRKWHHEINSAIGAGKPTVYIIIDESPSD